MPKLRPAESQRKVARFCAGCGQCSSQVKQRSYYGSSRRVAILSETYIDVELGIISLKDLRTLWDNQSSSKVSRLYRRGLYHCNHVLIPSPRLVFVTDATDIGL